MQKGTVTNIEGIWQGHPDVALFQEKIFVVYRASDRHLTQNETQIHITSNDSVPCRYTRFFDFKKPIVISKSKDRYNCPRLSIIGEYLYIICDKVDASDQYIMAENDEKKTRIILWRSLDGKKWEGPIQTNISGIVPDRIITTNNGFLIATHTGKGRKLVQNIWFNDNLDCYTSWKKFKLCHHKELNLCEASVIKIDKEFMCMVRENSSLGLPSYICKSKDGISWSNVEPTRMFGCHRPVCGMLKNGKLLTTYREASHSFRRGYWAKNTFACLSNPENLVQSIVLPLEHDRSTHSDGGYTGWVELPDSSIFIVNYITNQAINPYICWYTIRQNEF